LEGEVHTPELAPGFFIMARLDLAKPVINGIKNSTIYQVDAEITHLRKAADGNKRQISSISLA
jgi:hypothetical protein